MSDSTDFSAPRRGFTGEDLLRWERVRQRLRAELGDAIYDSWFTGLELERVDGDAVQLTVPTKFLKSWVQTHYLQRITARVATEFGTVERVTIELRSTGRKVKAREAEAERTAPAPQDQKLCSASSRGTAGKPAAQGETDGFNGSPLDRRLSFSTFLVGPPNQLAYAAACRVAEQRSVDIAPFFNPLYTHAAVGLGKTHLLQAMAHAAYENKRRVVYLTAEKFMSSFVLSLTAHTSIAFKENLRAIDMLIIDDVQFLQGKSIQQEFCHTLNALIDAGRQVVVAADRRLIVVSLAPVISHLGFSKARKQLSLLKAVLTELERLQQRLQTEPICLNRKS